MNLLTFMHCRNYEPVYDIEHFVPKQVRARALYLLLISNRGVTCLIFPLFRQKKRERTVTY